MGGFWSQLMISLGFGNKECSIVLLGLDNAGKSSLLHRMSSGSVLTFAPTQHAHEESFQCGAVTFRAWDLGGQETMRHLWDNFMCECNGIVFMVDISDSKRIVEASEELHGILSQPGLSPCAVLLNKCDISCVSTEDVCEQLQLVDTKCNGYTREFRVFRTSVVEGAGCREAFQWLSQHVQC